MNEVEQIIAGLEIGTRIKTRSVSGGSINDAFQVETAKGNFFLKLNSSSHYPGMFEAEERGLELLSQSSFTIPKPLQSGTLGGTQFFLMEWMEQGIPKEGFWDEFGRSLAELHLLSSESFGLDHDNYIGSLRQSNAARKTWADFYRNQRLMPQMKLAEKAGRLTPKMQRGFEALFVELENLFPIEKPSLLHGDLWSGNMMVAENGSPSIFDPAVYYGHREMDLAMMALFGGFGSTWVEAYNHIFPLEAGWKERIPLGQLYPLMVHANLFGGGYAGSVERILSQYT